MRGLDGKVAVVTGGANGIGRACSERFAAEGCAVVVADLLEEPGRAAAASLIDGGARAVFVPVEAASPEANEAMIAGAVAAFGGIDVLVTAAGISYAGYRSGDAAAERAYLEERTGPMDPMQRFVDTSLDEWHEVLAVNLTGTLLAVQAAARQLLAQDRGGAIVTVASIAAKHPEAGSVAYGVSKAGVWMVTKQAAAILAPAGIRVNAVGPGFIDTNMTRILRGLGMEREFLDDIPMGRFGRPQEIADAVAFLASDEASYITGELLHPDGGFYTD